MLNLIISIPMKKSPFLTLCLCVAAAASLATSGSAADKPITIGVSMSLFDVAVNDVTEAQAQAAVDSLQVDAKVYASAQELINTADLDAVVVASWGPTHEEFVMASIAAGKPVFCEKPLAVTAEGCRKIVDAEIAYGKKLVQVGFMRRYDQGYRALKETILAGTIGAPLMLHCAHRNPTAPGFSGDMAITDSLVHELDVLRWLLDEDYVSAQVIQPKRTRLADEGLQDPHIILLETTQGIRIVWKVSSTVSMATISSARWWARPAPPICRNRPV